MSITELPAISGIPIVGYYDREISYKDVVSMASNKQIDKELRQHYRQIIRNIKKAMIVFKCEMDRFIILQNPTTCKLRIWFD